MLLSVNDLHVYYGAIHAVKGVSLEVNEGEIVTLIGANGAGKSTVLNTISGLLRAKTGTIEFMGTPINTMAPNKIVQLGLAQCPEGRRVFAHMTVEENLEMGAYTRPNSSIEGNLEHVYELFPRLKERSKQISGTLSGGEQQMLAMGRAMMSEPKLLVLDEPNSGLDPRSRKDFQLLLQRLAREDYTILISSHILSELADLCTSIGVINGGVMVQQGKLENIMLAIDSSNPLRITVLNQVPKALELLRQDPQVSRLSVDENKIAAWFSGSREEEAYLLQKLVDAGILVVSFAREHNSLESLFFHLTGETEQKSRNTETFGNTIG